ncbi:Myb/SANT-like domain [Macleaya cordata]|uniref:Myb/SANT-like domain n=1 Tax=Macleaya cordata TaxID=56857 RepID=A0A200R712_MACCD|nr:Myb/SANT-like domain [Macleaya cordata]
MREETPTSREKDVTKILDSIECLGMDSSDSQPEVDNKGKGKQIRWTQGMDDCMIETFVQQTRLGHKEEKGFNDQAYDAVMKALADRLNVDVSKKHVDHRLRTLRSEFCMFSTLREQGGFEWDPTKNKIITTDTTWNDYIKAHPKFKHYRGRACKWDYDSLDIIIGKDNPTESLAIVGIDSSDSQPEVDEGKGRQLRWTQEMDECMIEILIEQVNLGRKGDRGFKDQAYNAVTKALADRLGVDVSRAHMDNRLRTFRTEYRMFRTLREQSGFDWDPVKNRVTASDSTWNEYLKAHPKFKYYRGRSCKWNYESLGIILGDTPATGSFALACLDSSDSQPEVDNKGKGRQLRWTQGMDERLIETFVEQVRLGQRGDKGFNDQTYSAVTKVLAERLDVDVGRKHIDNRLRTLRNEYRLFSTLRRQAGFCWDPTRSMVTAPDGVWSEYIKAHPEFKTCRGRSCKWDYESLAIIFGSDHIVSNNHATESFSMDGADVDITSTPIEGVGDADELPLTIEEEMGLDDINEEVDRSSQELRRKPSPIQQRRVKKARTADIVREVMEVVKAKIGGLDKSVDGLSFAKKLYSEVMRVEGFSPDFLDRAFEILKRDGHGAEIFLVRNETYRKRMLEELYQKFGDSGGTGRTD